MNNRLCVNETLTLLAKKLPKIIKNRKKKAYNENNLRVLLLSIIFFFSIKKYSPNNDKIDNEMSGRAGPVINKIGIK